MNTLLILDRRDFAGGSAFVKPAGNRLLELTTEDGHVVATVETPNGGWRLTQYALEQGARFVVHAYDLKIDER